MQANEIADHNGIKVIASPFETKFGKYAADHSQIDRRTHGTRRLHSMDLHDGAKFPKEESAGIQESKRKFMSEAVYAGVDVGGGDGGLERPKTVQLVEEMGIEPKEIDGKEDEYGGGARGEL